MNSQITIPIVFLWLTSTLLVAQEASKLPREAARLIEQLDAWEEKRRNELETALAAKRSQVAQLLRRHQEEATKAGDLDGALAIRETIHTLNKDSHEKESGGVSTVSKAESDPLLAGSFWASADSQTTFTITQRDQEAFDAIVTVGEDVHRKIAGSIQDNQLSWKASDVRALRGGKGGDNTGIVRGDAIDFSWSNGKGQSGDYSLQLLKESQDWLFGRWTESKAANRKERPLEISKNGTASHGSSGTWSDDGNEVVITWKNGVVTRIQKLTSDRQVLRTIVARRDGKTSHVDYVRYGGR